jgi:hypothetical protein
MKILLALIVSLSAVLSIPASAQIEGVHRPIPVVAAKVKMQVLGERNVTLNDKPYLLSPGAVIRNEQNMIVLTTALSMRGPFIARVMLDRNNQVSQAWILTEVETTQSAPKLN